MVDKDFTKEAFYMAEKEQRLVVVLIKPSKYDQKGFVLRYEKGYVTSNSLGVMNGITQEQFSSGLFSDVQTEVHAYESAIVRQQKELDHLFRRFPEEGTKLVVALVAVQTNQFPHALDIAKQWQARGATVVTGGLFLTSYIATMLRGIRDKNRPDVPCPEVVPPEVTLLIERGIIVFEGEADYLWGRVLRDILDGNPQQWYKGGTPHLQDAPMPIFPTGYFQDFIGGVYTCDTARGCIWTCSFCGIINAHGRTMRPRDPGKIIAYVRRLCEAHGAVSLFFTDDNFARNPCWEEILDGLIKLRGSGFNFTFMAQIDLAAVKISGFVQKYAQAGGSKVFLGIESMNPKNLKDATKRQNKVEEYQKITDKFREYGIVCEGGYILGFSHDTRESIRDDMKTLHAVLDQAAFFILTPLPGSEDHIRAREAGVPMDPDFNKYDSFQSVSPHSNMSLEEIQQAYHDAWRGFYRPGRIVEKIRRQRAWPAKMCVLLNSVADRWASLVEKTHPMQAGWWRVHSRKDMRPGHVLAPLAPYWLRELIVKPVRYAACFLREFFIFQYVVLESGMADEFMHRTWQEQCEEVRSWRDWARWTFGKDMRREWLNRFWVRYGKERWHLLWKMHKHIEALPYVISEIILTIRYLVLIRGLLKSRPT